MVGGVVAALLSPELPADGPPTPAAGTTPLEGLPVVPPTDITVGAGGLVGDGAVVRATVGARVRVGAGVDVGVTVVVGWGAGIATRVGGRVARPTTNR